MTRRIAILLPAAAALLMAACADEPAARQETPHHYSVDRYGNRLACYPMGGSARTEGEAAPATEYECLPDGGYGYGYRPYAYDPFWEFGLFYGWYWPYNTIIVTSPSAPHPPRRPKDQQRYSRSTDRAPPSAPPSRDRSPPSRRPDR